MQAGFLLLIVLVSGCSATKPGRPQAGTARFNPSPESAAEVWFHEHDTQASRTRQTASPHESSIRLTSGEKSDVDMQEDEARESGRKLSERLRIPEELPGADATPIAVPLLEEASPEVRESLIDELFPSLPKLKSDIEVILPSGGVPLTLEELQQRAVNRNPLVLQAEGDVQAAFGAAVQAGLYPNPVVGYEADTVGSAGTRNYQGMFMTQTIKTAGKLTLARQSANVDLMNAQLALRKARSDLFRRVRQNYYAVLVARENVQIAEAIVRFTNEVFRVQVDQLKGGEPAAYEPVQLRTYVAASRSGFQMARNRYISAWMQLAAAVGEPDLPPTELAGRGDLLTRPIDFQAALQMMLEKHTDVLAARNLEAQGRVNVRRAEVTPIPDVNVYTAIQRDFTTPGIPRTTYNLQLGVPLPLFDRNQGNIAKSRGELVRVAAEPERVRLDLTALLAAAFEQYENNRIQFEYYRKQILPDQARVYRGVYERHQQESNIVGFTDVVFAQQNLLTAITTYIAAMTDRWTAFTDIAWLLQLDDVSEMPHTDDRPALP